jgi:hypothetical protein
LGTLQQGQPRDVFTLTGNPQTAPWAYLTMAANDSRIIGDRHMSWNARLFELPNATPEATNIRECLQMVMPYDFAISFGLALGPNGLNPCLAHGFIYPDATESWIGSSPPPSADNVQTRLRVLSVDDFGRTTSIRDDRDVYRGDDDMCTDTAFAKPDAGMPRVLSAVSSVRNFDCDKGTAFASKSFNYDALPAGRVSAGRLTSSDADRRATDSGAVLRKLHLFDGKYDAAGNLTQVTARRHGSIRNTHIDYDPFGLAPIRTTVNATALAARSTYSRLDAASLQVLATTDVHGVTGGTVYDGFGRPSQQTLMVPAGASGVMSTVGYDGFDGQSDQGRRVTVTRYSDPVAPASLAVTPGRSATTYMDELGRARRQEQLLGSDYADARLISLDQTFDEMGRLSFEAEPYASSDASPDHFGTTHFYKDNGDVRCLIRGAGVQVYTHSTDVLADRYVTCFDRTYANHAAIADVLDAVSLASDDPQQWVSRRVVSTAAGWTQEHSTLRGGYRLEYATFQHDLLGQLVSMTKFKSPVTAADAVTWSWRRVSIGNAMRMNQPGSPPRYFNFDDWNELTDIHWMDGATERRLSRQFDALGRPTQTSELQDGVPDMASAKTFFYASHCRCHLW